MNRTDRALAGYLAISLATLTVASMYLVFGQRLSLFEFLIGDSELLKAVVGAQAYLLLVAGGHLIIATDIFIESRTLDSEVYHVTFDESLRESKEYILWILPGAAILLLSAEAYLT